MRKVRSPCIVHDLGQKDIENISRELIHEQLSHCTGLVILPYWLGRFVGSRKGDILWFLKMLKDGLCRKQIGLTQWPEKTHCWTVWNCMATKEKGRVLMVTVRLRKVYGRFQRQSCVRGLPFGEASNTTTGTFYRIHGDGHLCFGYVVSVKAWS